MKTKKIIKLNIFSKKKMKDKIKNHLWDAFETLRIKTSLNDLEAFKAVFTLYAFKHLSDRNDLTGDFGWDKVINKPVEDLFVEVEKILMRIKDSRIKEAVETLNLSQLNNKIPKDVKEYLINFFSGIDLSSEGKHLPKFIKRFSLHNPDFFESISLNRLVIGLLKPHEFNLNIHFPDCKTGQILIYTAHYLDNHFHEIGLFPLGGPDDDMIINCIPKIKTTVINKDVWGISYLIHKLVEHRSKGYQDLFDTEIKLSNYFLKSTDEGIFISTSNNNVLDDLIDIVEHAIFFVCPFGTNLSSDDDLTLSLNGRVFEFLPNEPELFYLIRGINHLYRKGRLAVVLPAYALSKNTGNYKNVREFLVNEDLIEVIVQLPKGIFPYIKEQLVLLQINTLKEEKRRRKIAFIKADGTMQDGIKEITDSSIKIAVYVYENFTPVHDNRIVFIKDVQQKDYNLTPSLYLGNTTEELKKMIRAKTVRRLGDICKIIEGQYVAKSYKAKGIPVISTNNLCRDIKDLYLKLDDLSYIDPKSHPETIKDRCIIVSVVDNEIKPTIFDPKKLGHKEIVLEKGVAAIFPDKSLVDFDYLYYQLNGGLIKTQYEEASVCRDEFNRSIFPQLKKIVIPLPDKIEEQRSFAYQQKIDLINAEDAQNQALRETLRLRDEKKEAEFQIVRHLGHSLNRRIGNVESIMSHLEEFINRKGLSTEPLQEIYYEGQEEIIVKDKIKEALNDLRQMHKLISGTRDIVTKAITQKDFVHTNVKKLFENKILHRYHGHNFKINFNCPDNAVALIHESSFIEAFDNIIRNAEEHDFKDKKEGNEIYFWIHDDKDSIIIDYANNGMPFPQDMEEKEYLSFGVKGKSSNGTGLGRAYVKLMLEAHNGDFEIMRKPKKLLAINESGEFFIEEDRGFLKYAVYFRFTIPKRRQDE